MRMIYKAYLADVVELFLLLYSIFNFHLLRDELNLSFVEKKQGYIKFNYRGIGFYVLQTGNIFFSCLSSKLCWVPLPSWVKPKVTDLYLMVFWFNFLLSKFYSKENWLVSPFSRQNFPFRNNIRRKNCMFFWFICEGPFVCLFSTSFYPWHCWRT